MASTQKRTRIADHHYRTIRAAEASPSVPAASRRAPISATRKSRHDLGELPALHGP
jgi:hypothetical protein